MAVAATAMNPQILAALIGAGSSLLGTGMQAGAAQNKAPYDALSNVNPANILQNLQMGFNVPGMQGVGGRSMGQQLLGGM